MRDHLDIQTPAADEPSEVPVKGRAVDEVADRIAAGDLPASARDKAVARLIDEGWEP